MLKQIISILQSLIFDLLTAPYAFPRIGLILSLLMLLLLASGLVFADGGSGGGTVCHGC